MRSLGARVTALLLLVTGTTVVATAASTQWLARQHLRTTLQQRLTDEANDVAGHLDAEMWKMRRDLETWTELQPMELLRTGDPDRRLATLLRTLAQRSHGIAALHAVGDDGIVRASSDATATGRHWTRPRLTGHAGPVSVGERNGSATMLALWTGIRSQRDGATLGTLVADLQPAFLDGILGATDRARIDEAWFRTVLVDGTGNVIAGDRPAELALGTHLALPEPTSDRELAALTIGDVEYVTASGAEPGYNDFSGLGWWVIAMQPTRDALALDRLLARASALVACSMLLIAGILGSVGARTVVRPIHELARLMERAATGDFSVRAASERRDEVGALARAFDAMVQDLSRIVAELADARHSQSVAEDRERLADLKTRFVAMASHEFRTPLAVIFAASDTIRRYGPRMTAAQQDERLAKIGTNVRFMTELLDDVMLLGRTESGSRLRPATFDLGGLLRELCEEIRATHVAAHVQLRGDDGAGLVRLDPKLTRQILRNLVSNAVKYSPEGAPVTVTVEGDATRLRVAVADRGIGIPVTDQARLFEPFQRATNVGEIQGTGLGLAITRKAVDLMGGSIMVASSVGEGTTFRLTLPRTLPTSVEEATAAEALDERGGEA